MMQTAKTLEPPKMLTIRQTAAAGPLSEYTLRLMLKQGTLPGVFVGSSKRKFLVNYGRLLDLLNEATSA